MTKEAFWLDFNSKNVNECVYCCHYGEVANSRVRHFHSGYGIFYCDSIKYDLMLHWITMYYAVFRMKMPHVRDSAISIDTHSPVFKYITEYSSFIILMYIYMWNCTIMIRRIKQTYFDNKIPIKEPVFYAVFVCTLTEALYICQQIHSKKDKLIRFVLNSNTSKINFHTNLSHVDHSTGLIG